MGNRSARDLVSVGIDIGTTTTQVVFSALHVRDVARLGQVPRLEVDDRALLHVGQARRTPLAGCDVIDVDRLHEIVEREYAAAGREPDGVHTGAVIITGETARRHNADAVLETLAALAGDFVVTVAGPALEGQIAARGSGAARWSAEHYTTVANVDIGGGSTNVAVFRSGGQVSAAAAMLGGRGLGLDPATGRITHITPDAGRIVEHLRLPIDVGARADLRVLRAFTDGLADLVVDLITGRSSTLLERLRLTPPLGEVGELRAVFLSGGIGRCYYEGTPASSVREVAAFGDVGPLVADALRTSPRVRALPVLAPAHTLQATVIGAASRTVTLSGTTIWACAEHLPLRDLPVVRPAGTEPSALARAHEQWSAEHGGVAALALQLPRHLSYPDLVRLVETLARYARTALSNGGPLVIVTEEDYAKVLGQTLAGLAPELPIVAVDQVSLREGDYIDIGTPLVGDRAVPVTVKTLAFYE